MLAPMAGGPSTPELVYAVSQARALGFLAAGYKTSRALSEEIVTLRSLNCATFGVNVFVPGQPTAHREEVASFVATMADDAAVLDTQSGEPEWDDDEYSAKIEVLLADTPAVVSFTFGCPEREVVDALQHAGATVVVTVTSPDEALMASALGADGLCVQGIEAGAHRATFVNDEAAMHGDGILTLLHEVSRVTDVALIGAGGVMEASDVRSVLEAGAIAAQCGTAFLRSFESGASQFHQDALASGLFDETVITRAFSGRPARALLNRFVAEHAGAPAAYPEINRVTRPLRTAAAKKGDLQRMSLWAGTGFARARALPAAEIVERLAGS